MDLNNPDALARFERHRQDVADMYNRATPEERKQLDAGLLRLKALRVSSVGGLRGIFPNLTGKLTVTKEGLKNG